MRTALAEVQTCLDLAGQKGGKAAMELLAAFGLESLASRHPQSLSGGEKQRLVIACALAKKPRLLILDEPLAGLDVEAQADLIELLVGIRNRGQTVIVISHDVDSLTPLCPRTIRLEKGTLAATKCESQA